MPITITKHYTGRCTDCGHHTTNTVETEIDRWATTHTAEHQTWKETGTRLADKVYDIDAPGVPWFGHVDPALQAARAAGYEYLTWNGWVYHVDAYGDPVCMAKDLPATNPQEHQ